MRYRGELDGLLAFVDNGVIEIGTAFIP